MSEVKAKRKARKPKAVRFDVLVPIRMERSVRDAYARAAELEGRPVSSQMRRTLSSHVPTGAKAGRV